MFGGIAARLFRKSENTIDAIDNTPIQTEQDKIDEYIKESGNGFTRFIDKVSNVFRSEKTKENIREDQVREARYAINKEANQDSFLEKDIVKRSDGLKSFIDKERAGFEAEKKQYEVELQELGQLPEFSDEYFAKEKALKSKKTSILQKQSLLEDSISKYNSNANIAELVKMERSPISDNFSTETGISTFVDNHIRPFMYNEKGEYKLDNQKDYIKFQTNQKMISSVLGQTSDIAQGLIREGVIDSEDDLYNSREFSTLLSNISNSINMVVEENFENVVDPNNEVIGKELESILKRDPNLSNSFDAYESFIRTKKSELSDVKATNAGTGLGKFWANSVRTTKKGINGINSFVENITESKNKNTSFFGDAEIKRLIYNTAGTNSIMREIHLNVTNNPFDVGLLAADVALLFVSGGLSSSKFAATRGVRGANIANKVGKISGTTKAINTLRKSSKFADSAILSANKALKFVKNRSPHIFDEIVKSVPLDLTLDARTDEYNNLGINTVFNSLGGVLVNPKKAAFITRQIEEVTQFKSQANRIKSLNAKGIKVDSIKGLDVMSDEGVERLFKAQYEAIKNPATRQQVLGLEYTKQQILNNPEIYTSEFYGKLFNEVLPKFDGFSDNLGNLYPEKISTINATLANPGLSEAEKAKILGENFVEIIDSYGGDLFEKYTKSKVQASAKGSLVSGLFETAKAAGFSPEESLVIANKTVFSKPKSFQELLLGITKDSPELANSLAKQSNKLDDDLIRSVSDYSDQIDNADDLIADAADEAISAIGKRTDDLKKGPEVKTVEGDILEDGQIFLSQSLKDSSKTQEILEDYEEFLRITGLTGGKKKVDVLHYFQDLGKYIDVSDDVSILFKEYGSIHKAIKKLNSQDIIDVTTAFDSMKSFGTSSNVIAKHVYGSLTKKIKKNLGTKMKNMFIKDGDVDLVLVEKFFGSSSMDKLVSSKKPNFLQQKLVEDISKYIYDPELFVGHMKGLARNLSEADAKVLKQYMKTTKGILDNLHGIVHGVVLDAARKGKGFLGGVDDVKDLGLFMHSMRKVGIEKGMIPPDMVNRLMEVKDLAKNEYQRTLIRGVGVGGFGVDPLDMVVEGILKGLEEGKPYNIPSAYFNEDGLELLSSVFSGKKGFLQYFENQFNKSRARARALGQVLVQDFYDGSKIKTSAVIGGRNVSLFNIISQIDPRLSQGLRGLDNQGGVVFAPMLNFTKYLSISDKENFLSFYGKMLNDFFQKKIELKPDILHYFRKFLTRQSGSPEGVKFGDAITNLYNEAAQKLGSKLRQEGIYDSVGPDGIADILHPILYSPEEYIYGLAQGDNSVDIVDTLLYELLGRSGISSSDFSDTLALVRGSLGDLGKGFEKYPSGAGIRNIQASQIEDFFATYMDDVESFNISSTQFERYLYKNIGYHTLNKQIGLKNDVNMLFMQKFKDAIKSKGLKNFDDISEEISKRFNDLIVYKKVDGSVADVSKKINGISSYLKKQGAMDADIDLMLRKYGSALDNNSKDVIKKMVVDDMISYLNNKTIDPTISGFTESFTPELFAQRAEEIQIGKENLLEKHIASMDKLAKELLTDPSLFKVGDADDGIKGTNIKGIADILGIKEEDAAKFLEDAGLDDIAATEIVTGKRSRLKSAEIVKATLKQMENGNTALVRALQNHTFRKELKTHMDGNGAKIIKGEWFSVDKKGNVVSKWEKDHSGVIGDVFKSMLSLNTLSLYDKETQGVIARHLEKDKLGRVFNPKIKSPGATAKAMSISAYKQAVKKNLGKIMDDNKLSVDDYKNVIDSLNDVISRRFVKGKDEVFANESGKRKLYEFMLDYFDDINEYRREPIPYTTYMSDVASKDDIYNRLTGRWINFSNEDIVRIEKKYKGRTVGSNAMSTFARERALGDFTKDIFYRGMFDKGAGINKFGQGISNRATRITTFLLYNPVAAGKGVQQVFNNTMHGRAITSAYLFDSAKLSALKKLITQKVDFSIIGGSKVDIALGSKGSKINSIDSILSMPGINVLVTSDVLTRQEALGGALSHALYNIYDDLGEEGVNQFLSKVDNYSAFIKKYNLTDYEFRSKTLALNKISEKAGNNVDKAFLEYDKLRGWHDEVFVPFQSQARANIATFYVTDNVRELGSIRLVDNNRYFFALKRWATGKFSEYGYRLAEEYKLSGGKNFISKMMAGDIPVMNQISLEIAKGLKLGWGVERLSGGELQTEDVMLTMAIPTVVASMIFFDAISDGIRGGRNFKEIDPKNSFLKGVTIGMAESVTNLFGTAFLYHDYVINSFAESLATANSYNDGINKVSKGVDTFVKSIFLDQFNKYMVDQYKGIYINTDQDGSLATNLLEKSLNVPVSKGRRKRDRLIEQMYSIPEGAEGDVFGYLTNMLYRKVPFIGNTRYTPTYFGVQAESIEEYAQEKNLHYFTDRFAQANDPVGLSRLFDEYEGLRLLEKIENKGDEIFSEDFKGKDIIQNREELLKKAFDKGAINDKLEIYDDIVKGLNFSLGSSEDLESAAISLMSDEEQAELAITFQNVLEEKRNKGKAFDIKVITNDFIKSQTQLGSNYAMGDYFSAVRIGMKNHLIDLYWGKDKEGKAKDRSNKSGEEEYTGNVSSEKYRNYIRDVRQTQKEIILENWDLISKNPYIGVNLKKRFIERDPDMPLKSVTKSLSHVLEFKDLQKVIEKEGYVGDEVMNKFNIMARNVSGRFSDLKPKDKNTAYKHMTKILDEQISLTNRMSSTPTNKAIAKMGLAYSISPMLQDFLKYDPEGTKNVVKRLGKSFVQTIDMLTNSTPMDIKTAYEFASGQAYQTSGKGGGSKNARLPAVKQQGKKNGKGLLDAINSANNFAIRLGKLGFPITDNKGTYSIAREGGGKIHEVKFKRIPFLKPQLSIPKPVGASGKGSKTKDLVVSKKKVIKSGEFGKRVRPKAVKKRRDFIKVFG